MSKKFWIVNKINPSTAEILMYGYISEYDISSADFIIELTQLSQVYNDIKIRINSGGGSVFEGIAIYNAIVAMNKQGKKIDTCVDGIAASMASVIAQAGGKRSISKYGRIMTHQANMVASGSSDDLRNSADLLESLQGDLENIFVERCGMTPEDVKTKLMSPGVDYWITADKCISMCLVDEIYDAEPVVVPNEDATDEKKLCNIFNTCLNKSTTNLKPEKNMKGIAKLLGLPEDATEAQIEAATQLTLNAKKTAEDAVSNVAKVNATNLVDAAITAGKFTADKKEIFVNMAIQNFDGTKAAIDLMPVAKKPLEVINRQTPQLDNTGEQTDVVAGKKGAAWDALVAKGMAAIEKERTENFTNYAAMYKEKFDRNVSEMTNMKA